MRRGPFALLAGLLTAFVLTAAPADADRQNTTDAARDVYRVPAGGTPALAPDNRDHDILRAGTVHRGRTLRLWLEVRRLPRAGYVATWDVKTPTHRWVMHHDRRARTSYTSLFHFHGSEVLDCGGIHGRALPRQERVEVRVRRSCIGRPRWIRFGASMGRDTEQVHFIDDARIDAGFFSNRCRLGPRVPHN